jgi:hypothetical protein
MKDYKHQTNINIKHYSVETLYCIFECINLDIIKHLETVYNKRVERDKLIKWDGKDINKCFDDQDEFCKANKIDIKQILNSLLH